MQFPGISKISSLCVFCDPGAWEWCLPIYAVLLLLAVAGLFGDDLWDVNYSDVHSSGGFDLQTWGGPQVRDLFFEIF